METWFFIFISICIAALIKIILSLTLPSPNLPPGPLSLPFIGNLFLLRKSFAELGPVLRYLHSHNGPVVTLRLGSRSIIFVSSRSLAHMALIQKGAVFADRPPPGPTIKILSSNQHSINSAAYGPTWRTLRRNLNSEILHPSRVRSYSRSREWVLRILLDRLRSDSGEAVRLIDHFKYAMFCLLALMCFGDRLEEKQIKQIEDVQRKVLLRGNRFRVLNMFPSLGKILFRGRWKEFEQLRKNRADVLLPLIRSWSEAREKVRERKESDKDTVVCYVDTLFDVKLPDKNRSLTEDEVLTLCSEFLDAGTDTTATALQWIMANLVKEPSIQNRIFEEIKEVVVSSSASVVKENDLEKLTYLKAVVLEGLRRHPPAHLLLFHAVTEETELGGYVVPKNWFVNFMVAEIGLDPAVWENPTAFKPERFLSEKGGGAAVEEFDITGSREIKMMPFGVGRRMCPGYNLALLHLEYFVANLVWAFEWKAEGDDVDLSEKQEFTMVMKNPLKSIISPRMNK